MNSKERKRRSHHVVYIVLDAVVTSSHFLLNPISSAATSPPLGVAVTHGRLSDTSSSSSPSFLLLLLFTLFLFLHPSPQESRDKRRSPRGLGVPMVLLYAFRRGGNRSIGPGGPSPCQGRGPPRPFGSSPHHHPTPGTPTSTACLTEAERWVHRVRDYAVSPLLCSLCVHLLLV